MNYLRNFALALLPAVILVACASGGDVRTTQISDQDAAKVMASNDNLIVPGERVGRVFLGMTTAQLYRVMGEPTNTVAYNAGGFRYEWRDLSVIVNRSSTVTWMITSGSTYSLAGGVTVGSSTLALQSNRPPPAFSRAEDASRTSYCYSDGLGVDTKSNNVVGIEVWSRGCNGSGHYSCFHWANGVQMIDGKCRRD